jgi:hypothetical protein
MSNPRFLNRTQRPARISSGNILISSTGEGRGEVDLYEHEEDAIADSHISIIRLRTGINTGYVLYYLQSLLGSLALKQAETAVKGTPEIYPAELGQIPVVKLPKKSETE